MPYMKLSFPWLPAILLCIGLAAAAPDAQAQAGNSTANAELNGTADTAQRAPDSATPPIPPVTVTGTAPAAEQAVPIPAPTDFTDCVADTGGSLADLQQCGRKLDAERHKLLEQCLNRDAGVAPSAVIRACTASIELRILHGKQLSFLLVNRADAYFAANDKQHALDDYDKAIELAPRRADLHYNRGVYYGAQGNVASALKDYDAALRLDPTLIPALQKRAAIYRSQSKFNDAYADYSQGIRLQPQTAALWSERGLIDFFRGDYPGAVKDEDEAIRLDSNLAQAHFFRGMAYGRLGDAGNARSDIETAVRLDPSLERYLSTIPSVSGSSAAAH
jgi:tetratricopeptide (TPR) repeat protein